MNALMAIPIILLALATGICGGILEDIHPLNADFRKLTFLMMLLFGAATVLCSVVGVIYGE